MFLRCLSKLVVHTKRHNRLLKVAVEPLLNTQNALLPLARCTATLESRPDFFNETSSQRTFVEYFLNNANRYNIVDSKNVPFENDSNFQSFKMLKELFDDTEQNEIPEEVANCFRNEVGNFSFDEICKFIIFISKYCFDTRVTVLLKELDKELGGRKFEFADMLKILFLMKQHSQGFIKPLKMLFVVKSTCKLSRKMYRLNLEQLVQLFFCMIKLPSNVLQTSKFSVQEILLDRIQHFNGEELGIIAGGFVKAGFKFTHPQLCSTFMNNTVKQIENMSNLALSNILKLIQVNLVPRHLEDFLNFQENLIPHVPKFNEYSRASAAVSGINIRCINSALWAILADDFIKNRENYNVLHIERIVYATTMYNIQDYKLLDVAVEEFRAKIDLRKHYNVLISLLYSLVQHNLYPEDLLSLVFSKRFTSEHNPEKFSRNILQKYCFINCCLEVDKPNHNYELLEGDERKYLFGVFKYQPNINPLLIRCSYSLNTIKNELMTLYGENSVCETKCLPHYRSGLVMNFEKSLKALPVHDDAVAHYYAKEAPKDGSFSLFLTVVPGSDFVGDVLCLQQQTRMKQLKTLGYHPVFISQHAWMVNFKKNTVHDFLKTLITRNLEMMMIEK